MFNRKNFCEENFVLKLIDNLQKRQYDENFINEVHNLKKNILKIQELQNTLQNLQKERNLLIGQGISTKNQVIEINNKIEPLEKDINQLEELINNILPRIPNLLHDNVPYGKNDKDNVEVHRWGTGKKNIKNHYDMNLIGNASEMTGTRFVFLQGPIATLERAIGNFLVNFLISRGFEEVSVPLMLSGDSLRCSGHLPKEEENMFFIPDKNLYLIPTSECVLVNLMANTVVNKNDLPRRFTAFNCNFRKEAGAYGKDTKGLIRLHQFPKVEMVAFTQDENTGMDMFNEFVKHGKDVLEILGLPYRIINLCSGDLGFNANITYDLEVWMAGSGEYREVSSISYCGTFQSENLKARWINDNGEKKLLHSLNGTCLAVGRLLAAIMEYYYDEDGYISIPEPLQKYTGFSKIKDIEPIK